MNASPGARRSTRLEKGTLATTPRENRKSGSKGTPPSTPPLTKKSEKVGKLNTPSPLRRSDRGKKDSPSSSLGAKSPKLGSPLESKRKKEKNLIQVTMESKRAELVLEEVGLKRKGMSARKYRGQFKKQRILETESDADEELERSEEIFDVCTDNSRGTGPEKTGMVGKLRNGIGRASNGAPDDSVSTSQDCPEEVKNEIHVHSSPMDDAMNVPCSASENINISESDGSVSSDGPKEATTSPSSACGNYNLLGTCALCSKSRRVGYDSLEQELCSCSPTVDDDLGCSTTCKGKSDLGAAVTSDSQRDGCHNVCALCNNNGKLLCCVGKGCKRCYHLCCLDPSLTETLPGVWHCPQCVKKKLLFGVHSVSEGVESIWDVREVEVSNVEGVRQKQYLVKYHGLAHIHNHWVPENQLLFENPCLVSNFLEKKETVRWSTEWTVPHRLLAKRPMQDKIYIASSAEIQVCDYEWLVKWCGLDYDHATWELDNSSFLSSSLGQNLIKSYEVRHEMSLQETNKPYPGFIVKLPELPVSHSHVNENHLLKNVNKLRECLFKSLDAVVFGDQERTMTLIFLIQSMSESCWPFLLVTTPSSLSHWEAEFAQLVPSLDVVVYGGSTDTRKGIRASEFYDEGRMMVRVLLSSVDCVSEDLEILRSIKWKAVVIDECQQAGISNVLEKIKSLSMDSTIIVVSGQIKDTTSQHVKVLSLLESPCVFDQLKAESNDNLCKLKDRLARFIAYGRTSQASKFIEYWIPVQISKFQLEQYCSALLSNSIPLCSCSRNDTIGVLHDILQTLRKCCSHPYLLDSSVQERLIAEGCTAAELLDIGIKACGKLKLLDVMLTEIKARDLKVLIIFQLMGSVGSSTGDILDDFLRQRFGPSTYERVDAGINPSKKQAAVNRFNKKETGQFVFLLENRACSSMIKLSPVDVVVIYDSDWNPSTDLRALQKISIDSKVEQVKVLRLYSSFTIEEKALVLAKQNLNLDNHLQNVSRATSETLLSWGATYLFDKLEEYHVDSESNSAVNLSSEQQFFDEVTKEFQSILSDNTNPNFIISEAKLGVGSYSTDIPVLGEAKVKLKDGEEPHVFWRKLFDGKDPKWKHLNLKGPSPRSRKRVRHWEVATSGPQIEKDIVKKRKNLVNENLVAASVQVNSGSHQATPIVASKGDLSHDTRVGSPGPSTIKMCNISESFQRGQSPLGSEVFVDAISDERIALSDEHLHTSLQGEMARLCQTLKFSEDVTRVARKFLEYVMKNHRVSSDSPSIVQAFQLSLCWAAASIAKHKVEKKDTIILAKKLLNYQCTEEQTATVYSKMRSLKRMYLQSLDNVSDSDRDCMLAENGTKKPRLESEGKTANEELAESGTDRDIMRMQRRCDKRMKKLIRKQQQEIQEFLEIWEGRREELEKDHRLENAFILSIHSQGQVRSDKLKLLEDRFAQKMEEHNLLKEVHHKELKAKQLSAIDEERRKTADWLAKKKAECSQPRTSVENVGTTNSQNGAGVILPPIVEHLNQSKSSTDANCSAPVEQVPGELSNASNKECDKTGKIVSSDDLVGQGGGSEEAASEGLHSIVQPLLPSEQTIASQDCCDLLQQQVQKDRTGQSLESAQPHESNAPAIENESTSEIELATSRPLEAPGNINFGHVHNSSIDATISCNQAPATENSSIDATISCNQAPATENCDQGRSSSQTTEHRRAEVLSQENLETHSNHLDMGPSLDAAIGHNVESSPILPNDLTIPQSNQAVPRLDINVGNLHRTFPALPSRQPSASNSAPLLLTDPLQNEIERIRKETAQLEKSHEDMVTQLRSDCEKEIDDIVSQIRKKYEVKHQETEAAFRQKRSELDKSQDKVMRNKILAEAFRSKCLDLRPSGAPGVPSNLQHQSPMLPPNRHSPGPSGSQPARTGPLGVQPARPMQHQSRVHPSRPVPIAIQSVAPPSVAARPVGGPHSASPRSATPPPTRPLVINSISPAGNPRVGANDLRSIAPHLQPFRPSSTPHAHSPSIPPHLQPLRPHATSPSMPPHLQSVRPHAPAPTPSIPSHLQPLRPPAPSPTHPATSPSSQLRPTPSQPGPLARPPPHPSSTIQGLLVAMERRPSSSAPEQRPTMLPDISSTFNALEQSDLDILGSVQGNQTSAVATAVATDVVCLSDDDN